MRAVPADDWQWVLDHRLGRGYELGLAWDNAWFSLEAIA